jgi:hypothetical protein
LQADGFRAFSNTIQGKKSADDGKKRWKTMTHRLENFRYRPIARNIGDARWSLFSKCKEGRDLAGPGATHRYSGRRANERD